MFIMETFHMFHMKYGVLKQANNFCRWMYISLFLWLHHFEKQKCSLDSIQRLRLSWLEMFVRKYGYKVWTNI